VRLLRAAAVCLLAAAPAAAADQLCPPGADDFPPFYTERSLFDAGMEKAADFAPLAGPPLGLTVPHHLLADRLVAGGLKLAAGHEYDRVILLSPDHFRRAGTLFATTVRGFQTVLGGVAGDVEAARALLAASPLV